MHFDAWVDPMKFWDLDFERIWMLDSASLGAGDGAPYYICMKDKSRYLQWTWLNTQDNNEERMFQALRAISKGPEGYDVGSPEYCTGCVIATNYAVPPKANVRADGLTCTMFRASISRTS